MAKLAHDGSSLSDTRMSFLQLSHFCQKVGILDETLNEASLRKIFRWVDTDMSSSKKGGAGGAGSRRGGGKSTSSGGFKNGRDHALHRPEFMEALIHIAMSKVDMGGRGGQTGGGEAADERVRDSVCFCGVGCGHLPTLGSNTWGARYEHVALLGGTAKGIDLF